jgi:heat shock protein HslJ
MVKRIIFLSLIILSLFSLQAKPKKKVSGNAPLHNRKWVLEEVFETPVVHSPDTAFIIFYDNYKFSGSFGCNTFFGEYGYGKKRMNLDYLGATKKLCSDMDLEEQFFKAIKYDITHYYIEKNNLYLLYKLKIVCKFRCDN